ncbi:TPA: Arm DNA-binding domain-containing protein [Salmonella enterica subsp. enterica serovar Muenchen]|uniref:Arm DNA-binding domain-containing protein n=1 Tax=Salmonella sp. SG203 TaxID=2555397 RepID=UPI00126A8957|nr:Arm DNA-binding domain-containing protein [Salmonella sp. SG203]EBS3610687.1 DUF4102 domain-containing protein [Salmonella enterica subsp. enterica serovar Poona]HAF5680563.1 DUF4102 domain-containing protein [Salmonella enterica]HEC7608499.1 DUF4102 domain-containing protein [Salmonella enterica subsp. enterica serovar Muenchen]
MATENKLSDTLLKKLHVKPQAHQKMIADGRGLSIRVSRQGGVSFVFTWREGGRTSIPKAVTLGRYPDTGLKQARQIRDCYRAQLAEQRTLNPDNEMAIPDGAESGNYGKRRCGKNWAENLAHKIIILQIWWMNFRHWRELAFPPKNVCVTLVE